MGAKGLGPGLIHSANKKGLSPVPYMLWSSLPYRPTTVSKDSAVTLFSFKKLHVSRPLPKCPIDFAVLSGIWWEKKQDTVGMATECIIQSKLTTTSFHREAAAMDTQPLLTETLVSHHGLNFCGGNPKRKAGSSHTEAATAHHFTADVCHTATPLQCTKQTDKKPAMQCLNKSQHLDCPSVGTVFA